MTKRIIHTALAPAPIGPYNQAILVGNTLYTSGQIALDAETMELKMDSISMETNVVMNNLKHVLQAADMSFDDVVKATIYVTDMANFAEINGIYGGFFDENIAPARETVQVAGLPKGVNVEISVIAIKTEVNSL